MASVVNPWRTLRESVLLPATAALLPWSAGFRLLQRYSRRANLYREVCEAALAGASTIGGIADPLAWKRRHLLIRLVDHCDLFLVRTRSRRWLRRFVDIDGEWPSSGPFIAMTFHWGAGLWALAQLRASGRRARFVSARIHSGAFHGDRVAHAYARARNRTVERAGGGPVIYTGGATSIIRDALRAGDVVVALYDLPADNTHSTIRTVVCDRAVRLPAGLARVAVEEGAAVVPFSMGLDGASGRRKLRIEPAFRPVDAQEFADRLGRSLTRLISEDSAAWHFSAFAPQFFASGQPAPGEVVRGPGA